MTNANRNAYQDEFAKDRIEYFQTLVNEYEANNKELEALLWLTKEKQNQAAIKSLIEGNKKELKSFYATLKNYDIAYN